MTIMRHVVASVLLACAASCGSADRPADGKAGEATFVTAHRNAEFGAGLNLADRQDFEEARRGFIAKPTGKILGPDSAVMVDFDSWGFLDAPAPPTVNPSLWRHAQLNAFIGLFKVTDGIYQLRGFGHSGMTLIEGKTGWIVIDPLTSQESAAAAIAFARKHLGARSVSAVVFTHSHIDHFGGVLGVITAAEVAARHVPIIAPEGFLEEATSENVLVGGAMGRRARYQFGQGLPRSATGFLDTGLGKEVGYGTYGILAPTRTVSLATETFDVDGVPFVFHNTPGAEAPAELTFSLPTLKAYCGAELVTQNLHNLLPIRGAKVRDALKWSRYLDEALEQSAGAEVLFAQHNWPVWGRARIVTHLTQQRDTYKYLHDQTVRLLNAGYTPSEIAATVTLPASLQSALGSRGYYGDVRHNVKAIYQFYLGNYDGNPAHLDALPPEESAPRYVALMGGADKVMAAATTAFEKGEYRWGAELLNQLVFAEPKHAAARELLARTYEQLAYAAESSTWRNSYLVAADELRHGPPPKGITARNMLDVLAQAPIERFLDAMAASLDGPAAAGKDYRINLVFSDTKESFVLWIENAVLHYRKAPPAPNANATLTLTKGLFVRMMAGAAGVQETIFGDDLSVRGSKTDLVRFLMLIEKAKGVFPVVTP
ncbi:MAG TPA: alkyl sulfatase dimerization domain-containing protein [Gemmatimonadaceae bacterium]|jgi:alkyl sulfatase BDS1-like metallo-beta-lactamase superfamily hydrolase